MVRLRGSGPRDPGSNPGGPIKLRKNMEVEKGV